MALKCRKVALLPFAAFLRGGDAVGLGDVLILVGKSDGKVVIQRSSASGHHEDQAECRPVSTAHLIMLDIAQGREVRIVKTLQLLLLACRAASSTSGTTPARRRRRLQFQVAQLALTPTLISAEFAGRCEPHYRHPARREVDLAAA